MHVSSVTSPLSLDPNSGWSWNWNWLVQFLLTALVVGLGFLHLLRSTASKYFVVDANFDSSSSPSSTSSFSLSSSTMPGVVVNAEGEDCAVCGKPTTKQCSACKVVKYCSQTCQSNHWKSEHKTKCKKLKLSETVKSPQHLGIGNRNKSVALVPLNEPGKSQKLVNKVLFPYDEFVKLFSWDKDIFPPCGLLNCGNSCFANVVLQCLGHTRPLLAYLLDKGHRRDCRRDGWCFLCELQLHMERASRSAQPFSPINILSRLPSMGGNLGYGEQEDAHEFMRFAIDTMQSVCLDEHGGEKVIHPKSQETTLIQHIFGGQLRSQVICTQCSQVSNRYDNMMDLTVEIQGDQGGATSLQECLDQFTAKEWLDGENMYKCDGCNKYVRAWKRLTIHQAPNILTIALKRFQSGRFGKINKRITFPESLDLSPYMSEKRDGTDKYKLYAVVVHVDMLNASFFGHYICYTKGFQGEWYRIDDCKVTRVQLDEVLSQGAYMLLYSRETARPTCLKTFEPSVNQQPIGSTMTNEAQCSLAPAQLAEPSNLDCSSVHLAPDKIQQFDHVQALAEHLSGVGHKLLVRGPEDSCQTVNPTSGPPVAVEVHGNGDAPMSDISCAHGVFKNNTSVAQSNEIPDISGSSDTGQNASSDMSCKASSASMASDQETDKTISINGLSEFEGILEENRYEDEPHVTGTAESSIDVKRDWNSAMVDQTAPFEMSCTGDGCVAGFSHQTKGKRYDTQTNHLDPSKVESEVSPNDIEVDRVEPNVSDCCSIDDDETMDESSTISH